MKFKYSVGDLVQTVQHVDVQDGDHIDVEAQTICGIILETNELWKSNRFLEEACFAHLQPGHLRALENDPYYRIHPDHPPQILGLALSLDLHIEKEGGGRDWWVPEYDIELKAKP